MNQGLRSGLVNRSPPGLRDIELIWCILINCFSFVKGVARVRIQLRVLSRGRIFFLLSWFSYSEKCFHFIPINQVMRVLV